MLIKNLIQYVKYKRMLDKIYDEERVIVNLSRLFDSEFKRDWIGRLYTVVNPRSVNPDPVSGSSTQIYEFMSDGTLSDNMFVEKWVMDKLNVAATFFRTNNLFELASYRLDKIDDYDNWLFIIQPVPWEDLKKSLKRAGIITASLIVIAIILLIIF